ncbi:cryptochrome/photolyase family protein [Thalassolituus sp. LLYu03]|uniref:cryptochrome/photolyase family protein n=1 Tax=Thalassolituus sp. LLYu03 TaxID=3421656 RepID=UPI003D26D5F7
MSRLGLILADQLTPTLASLRVLDPQTDTLLFAEVADETAYVPHHPQKIALLFSAMRHFADECRAQGFRVLYHAFDPTSPVKSLISAVQQVVRAGCFDELILTECGEYRLQHAMDDSWPQALGIPVIVYEDDRFIFSAQEFRQWTEGRKQLRMEYFYREMRRKTGLLMEGDKPVGGQWNFDADNRAAYKGEVPVPARLDFTRDSTDEEVLALVSAHFGHHMGDLQPFRWATTREQALTALQHFIDHRLPHFGRYQDAMVSEQALGGRADALFHSLLSPYINCGLLTAMEVCLAAEAAYYHGQAPLAAVEGFIRQIIGWREYVRGIYWTFMPHYAGRNELNNQRPLPAYYWSGQTRMHCMSECFRTTFSNAYAHHIQRLMVTGNFALLTGIRPQDICDWYLAVYADAYDWVELPNTLGMMMHADGGLLGSKPYCASGSYIARQSDYCAHCPYQVKTAEKADSCPFNSLYWHFLIRHRDTFARNPRMGMMYRSFDRMDAGKQKAILARADYLLNNLDSL